MVAGQPGRKPGCFPKMVCNWVTRSWLVLRTCSSEGRGIVAQFYKEQLSDYSMRSVLQVHRMSSWGASPFCIQISAGDFGVPLIAYMGIRLNGLLYLLHGTSRFIHVPEWLKITAGRFLMLTKPLLALRDGATGLARHCILIRASK